MRVPSAQTTREMPVTQEETAAGNDGPALSNVTAPAVRPPRQTQQDITRRVNQRQTAAGNGTGEESNVTAPATPPSLQTAPRRGDGLEDRKIAEKPRCVRIAAAEAARAVQDRHRQLMRVPQQAAMAPSQAQAVLILPRKTLRAVGTVNE